MYLISTPVSTNGQHVHHERLHRQHDPPVMSQRIRKAVGLHLTGVGTGLALPTFIANGSASLPPHFFATDSAVLNMLRQIGMAIGFALLIAVLGMPRTASDAVLAHRFVMAAIALAAGVVALALLARRRAPNRGRDAHAGAEI
jgi:uncharacterized membrane protein